MIPAFALLQSSFSPVSAALRGGPVGLLTLALLLLMSVLTWAIFLARRKALSEACRHSARAKDAFLDATDTEAFARLAKSLPASPVKRAFLEAHAHHEDLVSVLSMKAPLDGARVASGRELLARTLAGVKQRELQAARRGLVALATVGATAPFVGLFGTVWGIVKAFAAIGHASSADLAVVAPGIAEALVATAAGLVAAIPAVWFFNMLTSDVRRVGGELDAFAVEMLNVYDRAIATGGSSQ